MAGLQRFVTYIYRYEDRQKKENAGFAKIEIRGTICRIEIHVRNGNIRQQESQVYLFAEKVDHIHKMPLGTIGIIRGAGMVSFARSEEEFLQEGIQTDQLCGIGIFQGETMQLCSFWKDIEEDKRLRINDNGTQPPDQKQQAEQGKTTDQDQRAEQGKSTDQDQRADERKPTDQNQPADQDVVNSDKKSGSEQKQNQQIWNIQRRTMQMRRGQIQDYRGSNAELMQNQRKENAQNQSSGSRENTGVRSEEAWTETIRATELAEREMQKKEQSGWDAFYEKLKEKLPVCYPFEEDEMECFRMELKSLRELPSKYWYLGNNSFLLHGFFNYRHFLFGRMKTEQGEMYFIGVPGVFQNQERVMAAMFGFPEFRTAQKTEYKTGNYGYWYRVL